MKRLIYSAVAIIFAGNILIGCDATDNDLQSGWDTNRTDSSNVTVDTLQGIDISMYEKARIFPGLVDTAIEAHVKDTIIPLDLSKTYRSMADLNLKFKNTKDTREMPQPIYSTGLYAGAGELITITVPDNVWGLTAQIGVQTDDLTSNDAGLREPIVYTQKSLYPGKNTVRSPLGGYLWILRDPNKTGDNQTGLKIENAYAAPDFILGKTNPQAWAEKVKATTVPWLDLRGEHFTFSVDRQHILQYIANDPQFPQKMEKALSVWNSLIRNFYSSFGFQENTSDIFSQIPQFPDRFVFDVQLEGNKVVRTDNPQALAMVQTNRLYDNLVNLDSLSNLKIFGIYGFLQQRYMPKNTPFSLFLQAADFVPLYRQAEWNKQNGFAENIGNLTVNFTDSLPKALSFAAADSSKYIAANSKDVPLFTLLPLIQLAKYASYYRKEAEWQFYNEVWTDSRRENAGGDTYFIKKLCSHYQMDFTPFFEHWGIDVSDAARTAAQQYPLLDKSIWKIDPLANNPYAEVKNIDAGSFRYRVDRSSWTYLSIDKEGQENEDSKNNHYTSYLFDGNKNTYWRNYLNGDDSPYEQPYYVIIDMGKYVNIDGFFFANGSAKYNAMVSGFTVQTTNSTGFDLEDYDKQTWITLGQVGTSSSPQKMTFNEQFFKFQNSSHNVRYLRLVFDKPNLFTPKSTGKTPEDFEKYHWNRRQAMAEFGVYYYKK